MNLPFIIPPKAKLPAKLVDKDGNEVKTDDPCWLIRTQRKRLYLKIGHLPAIDLCEMCHNQGKCIWKWNTTTLSLFFTPAGSIADLRKFPIWKRQLAYYQLFKRICFDNIL